MIDNIVENAFNVGKEKQVIRAAMLAAGGFTVEALKKIITPLTLTGGGVLAALQAAAVNYTPFAAAGDTLTYNNLLSDTGTAARVYNLYNVAAGDTAALIAAIQGFTAVENAAPKTRNLATVSGVTTAAGVVANAWLSGVTSGAADMAYVDTAINELPRTSIGGADLETIAGVLGVTATGLSDADLKARIRLYFTKYVPPTAAEAAAYNYDYRGYGGLTSGGGNSNGSDAIL